MTPPTLDYQPPNHRPKTSVRKVMFQMVGPLLLILIILAAVLPHLFPESVNVRWTKARTISDLHQLSSAINLYTAHHRAYPDNLARLLAEDFISLPAHCLMSPAGMGDDVALESMSPEAREAVLADRNGGGWWYVGANIPVTTDPTVVLAYESLSYWGKGGHVLTADGQVHWLTAAQLAPILDQDLRNARPVKIRKRP